MIKKALDSKLDQLGIDWLHVESLVIRSVDKAVFASVALEGEEEPVKITAIYFVNGDDLVIESVEASKPWMAKALTLALATKANRFSLPKGMAGLAIRMLL